MSSNVLSLDGRGCLQQHPEMLQHKAKAGVLHVHSQALLPSPGEVRSSLPFLHEGGRSSFHVQWPDDWCFPGCGKQLLVDCSRSAAESQPRGDQILLLAVLHFITGATSGW